MPISILIYGMMNTNTFPKHIRDKIAVLELKREFGLADYYFFSYKYGFITSCVLSKNKYFPNRSNSLRLIDDPNEVLEILTNPKAQFCLDNRWYKSLQELYEEVLIMRLSGIL